METNEEPLRGPIEPTETEEPKDKSHVTEWHPTQKDADGKPLDWRTREYQRNMPKLSEHHEEIRKCLADGQTKRTIHTRIGVSRNTLDRYIADHEDLKQAWEDAQEDQLDLNEEIVSELATMDCSMVETDAGIFPRVDGRSLSTKFNAAKFRLERLGAKRGWNAKLETNEVGNGGSGRVPIIFCGEVTDAEIAEANAQIAAANEKAMEGLEGIPKG